MSTHTSKILLLSNSVFFSEQAVEEYGHEFDFARPDEFYYVLEHDKAPRIFHTANGHSSDLRKYRFIYMRAPIRDKILSSGLAHVLRELKYPFETNQASFATTSKLSQNALYHAHGLRIPKTIFIPRIHLENHLTFIEAELGYPFIMKSCDGRKGRDNFLILTIDELVKALDGCPPDMEFVFQAYIPNTFDYRFLVFDFETKLIYKRQRQDPDATHLNNVSLGGTAENVPLEYAQDLIPMANKAAELIGQQVCGVDLLTGNDGYTYILEANNHPGFKSLNGRDVLIEYVKGRAAKFSKTGKE